jgi:biotin carboxyl carrier protein
MKNTFKANVNEAFYYDISENSVSNLDIVTVEKNKFHVLHQKQSYIASIIKSDFLQKIYIVKINSNTYHVSLENSLDQLIKEMGFEMGATKKINSIKAPMPGLILEICVAVGQTVKENENLLILEAMKMENSFISPRNGIIKTISVNKGETVDKGMLLIEFE